MVVLQQCRAQASLPCAAGRHLVELEGVSASPGSAADGPRTELKRLPHQSLLRDGEQQSTLRLVLPVRVGSPQEFQRCGSSSNPRAALRLSLDAKKRKPKTGNSEVLAQCDLAIEV